MAVDDTQGRGRESRGDASNLSLMVTSGGLWSLFARFGHSLVMVLGTVVLARTLAPSDFGIVAITTSLTVLVLVIAEGWVDFPVVRANDLTEDRMRSLLWTGFGIAASIALVIALTSPFLEQAFGFAGLREAFLAITPIFFLQTVMVSGRAILRRQHRFREAARITFLSALSYVLAAIGFSLAGWGFWSLIFGQLLSNFLMAVQFGRAGDLSLRPPGSFDLSATGVTGGYGLVSRIFAWFWSAIDTIAIGITSSASATGLYSRAYNLSTQAKEPFAAVDHPIRQALVAVRERDGQIADVALRMVRLLTLATGLVAALIIVLRETIVGIVLGGQWAGAVVPLAILVASLPARIALNFVDSMVIVAGKMAHMVRRHAIMSLLIGAGVWFVAPYGIATVAMLVSAVLYAALLIPVEAETGTLPSRLAIVGAMVPGIGAGAMLVASGEVVRRSWDVGQVAFTLGALVIFGLVIAILAIYLPASWSFPALENKKRQILNKLSIRKR